MPRRSRVNDSPRIGCRVSLQFERPPRAVVILQSGHFMIRALRLVLPNAIAALCLAACSSTTTAPAPDATKLNGDSGGLGGNANVTGNYGADAIKPVVAAYWVGMPGDPSESAGGPFLYLFSTPVSCNDISKASGWAPSLPAGTQAMEMIVGTTATGVAAPSAPHAGAKVSEVNYFSPTSPEARAVSGSVTLTSYVKDVAVDGTIDVMFPSGNAKGTFHATWCAGGHER